MESKENSNPNTTRWSDVNLWKFSALITVSSTLENAIFYPFYVLKTREQSDRRNLNLFQSFKYHLRHTFSKGHDNLRTPSVYRGFLFSNTVSLPSYGLYLGVYISSKDRLSDSQNKFARFYAPFIAGALADAISVGLYVPSDVIVQRLQVADSPYKSAFDAVRKIYHEEGIKGYYRGLGATFVVTVLASSIWWTAYENVKSVLYNPSILPHLIYSNSNDQSANEVHRLPQIMAGFCAGTITSTSLNPLDVVKTRIQTQNIQNLEKNPSTIIYKNIIHGLKCLWVHEGIHGLFRGVVPKLISRGPLSAISALVFELVLYYSRDDIRLL